jgi:hypothetical protein
MATKLYNVYARKGSERTLSNDEPLDYDAGLRLCQGLNVGGVMTELIPVTNETARAATKKATAAKATGKPAIAILKGDSIPDEIVVKAAKVLDKNGYSRFDLVKLALSPDVGNMTYKQKFWVITESTKALERQATLDKSIAALANA